MIEHPWCIACGPSRHVLLAAAAIVATVVAADTADHRRGGSHGPTAQRARHQPAGHRLDRYPRRERRRNLDPPAPRTARSRTSRPAPSRNRTLPGAAYLAFGAGARSVVGPEDAAHQRRARRALRRGTRGRGLRDPHRPSPRRRDRRARLAAAHRPERRDRPTTPSPAPSGTRSPRPASADRVIANADRDSERRTGTAPRGRTRARRTHRPRAGPGHRTPASDAGRAVRRPVSTSMPSTARSPPTSRPAAKWCWSKHRTSPAPTTTGRSATPEQRAAFHAAALRRTDELVGRLLRARGPRRAMR